MLSVPAPSIVLIVKALPCFLAVSKESHFLSVVQIDLVKHGRQLVKVETHLSVNLASVYQHDELRFHSGIEVQFDFGVLVAVHSNMVKLRVLSASAFVVGLNFGTHWVPPCCEVQTRVHWLGLIHMLD